MGPSLKGLSAPIRSYFTPRFESLASEIAQLRVDVASLADTVAAPEVRSADPIDDERLRQARFLARVDVRAQNAFGTRPSFAQLASQAPSAEQCADPAYLEWFALLQGRTMAPKALNGQLPAEVFSRKIWEWAYIAEAAKQAGVLQAGLSAVGFGCGNEPLPAFFASKGLTVTATDYAGELSGDWEATGQLMSGLAGLSRPFLIDDEDLEKLLVLRNVDMNSIPDDIGMHDIVWSACVLEHLGSPQHGLDFILKSCALLKPGGLAVHTTELELTIKGATADYGHCAVYRLSDLVELTARITAAGFETTLVPHVAMDAPEDRWISLALAPGEVSLPDEAHLKLVIGDSVSTSFGILIRRPVDSTHTPA